MIAKHIPRLIPVVDRTMHHCAETHIRDLLELPVHFPLSIPRPWRWNEDDTKLSMTDSGDGRVAMLAWLPGNLTLLIGEQGGLFHNFMLPRPKLCKNDSTDGVRPCLLYNGTLVGVEIDEKDVWANDVFAIQGHSIIQEPRIWRQERLVRLKQCIPQLKLASENPNANKTKIWDDKSCAWSSSS